VVYFRNGTPSAVRLPLPGPGNRFGAPRPRREATPKAVLDLVRPALERATTLVARALDEFVFAGTGAPPPPSPEARGITADEAHHAVSLAALTPAQAAAMARFHRELQGLVDDERYRDTLPADDPDGEGAAILAHITDMFRILAERLLNETPSGAAARAWLSPDEALGVLLSMFLSVAYGDTPGRAGELAPPLSLQQFWEGQRVRLAWAPDDRSPTGRAPALLGGTEAERRRIDPYYAWLYQRVTGEAQAGKRGRRSGSGLWPPGATAELAAAVKITVRHLDANRALVSEATVAGAIATVTNNPRVRKADDRSLRRWLKAHHLVFEHLVEEARQEARRTPPA